MHPVAGGALALIHHPKLKAIPALRGVGATHLVTLLAGPEGALQVGNAATAAGLAWLWIPLEGGDVPGAERMAQLRLRLAEIAASGKVVVHCSAGIHAPA